MRDKQQSGILWEPPRPGVPVKTSSLILAYSRAQLTKAQWDSSVEAIRPEDPAIDGSAYTFRAWNWMSLWLGCLEVVAEGFEKGYEHDRALLDSRLTTVLASPNRPRLKGYRNKMFHPEPYTHEHVVGVLNRLHGFVPWAEELHYEFGRFFEEYLQT